MHYCAYCGWRREAASLTILSPGCERCGCCLSSCTGEHYEQAGLGREEAPVQHRRLRADSTGPFVVVAAGPFLLPVIGVRLGDLLFAIPFALLAFAAVHCLRTARECSQRRGVWIWLAISAGLASASSLVAVIASVAGDPLTSAFYLGASASVALLAACLQLARRAVIGAARERLVDGLMFAMLALGTVSYFVLVPGFRHGDAMLTAVVLIDLLAVVAAVASLTARPARRHRRVAWSITGVTVAAAIGDGLVSAGAAGQIVSSSWATALLWGLAGYLIAVGSELERQPVTEMATDSEEPAGGRWVWGRVVLPLLAVLGFPAIALALELAHRLTTTAGIYFGSLFVAVLTTAFSRQAYLLVENRRIAVRERGLRSVAVRRGDDLEALTALATTMTESLEEAPIMERGLGVLHLAARATSSALHAGGPKLSLRAAAGEWHAERPWANPSPETPQSGIQKRGGRVIARFPLAARGNDIGVITLVRADSAPFKDSELGLLALLVDQLAIAVQNARDYTEKLDQAIRDPLTGLYNRRFFCESLDKELHRTERYGSTVSVALFDIDDFKSINDTLGHSAGDDALRRISALVGGLLRSTDSFARLGGEEFGLLMPETQQLDALLVVERLRTAISRTEILPGRRVTVSGGVATCPQDAITHDDLINCADSALYWAKRNGKNLCAIAGEVMVGDGEVSGDTMIAHLHALVSTIDAHHLSTKDHSENVAAYAVAIGQALGLQSDHIVRLRRAAFLHDIGKVAVSREILEKPDPLTDDEWAEMKIHPSAGGTMLLHSGLGEEALWIRHHHERIDGRGYPDGLAGEEIPLESRILFVADAFEAMTSDRPYHRGIEVGEALEELERCAGSQFDPGVAATMISLVRDGGLTVLAMSQPS
jgi:diguanylate cyclase (GGDEF)-like protein